MKAKIDKMREERKDKEIIKEKMERLVKTKTMLEEEQKKFDTTKRTQNDKNTQKEKQLVDLMVELKRETLIKELNTMKSVKKSEANI